MMRNDYRRTLILLRSHAEGYSGHVRLERRTLMGGMYFMVQAPQDGGALQAALVGRGRTGYYACPLGELKQDGRGQACLSYSFDPRRICGRELEQYQLVAVARVEGEDCEIVLSGNVDGHAELNWERVRQALCLSVQSGPARSGAGAAQHEEKTGEQVEREREAAEELAEEAAEEETEEEAEKNADNGSIEEEAVEDESTDGVEAGTAGGRLGVDMSLPWPEEIEPLREAFRSQQAMEDGPDGRYIYIQTPLTEGSPYPYMAVGLRAEGGVPVQASYALPSAYAPEPPRGLEEYAWVGDQNRGWWVIEMGV